MPELKRICLTTILSLSLGATSLSLWGGPADTRKDTSETADEASQAKTSAPAAQTTVAVPHTEVTVTATRTPTESTQLGRSISVITSEQIDLQGEGSVQNLLEDLAGFSFTNTGSFGSQTSLFVRGGESNFNIVMVDGVQINQPGGEFDFANLATANVDRIEVVRGPSSVLYGAEAAASTINIITRTGEGPPSGHLLVEGGNYGSKLFSGAISGSGHGVSYSLGALHNDTDGIYAFNSQWDRQDLSGHLGYAFNADSAISATLRWTDSTQHFPTDSIGAIVDPNDYRTGQDQTYSAAYTNHVSPLYGTKISYGLNRHDSKVYTIEDGVSDFYNDRFDTSVTRHFLDWQNDFQLGESHLVTGGVSYNREDSRTQALNRRSVGVFFQDQVTTLNQRLFLTGGVRYDNNNRFSSFTTGNFDVALLVTPGVKLRGSLGNGFRAPDFNEVVGFPTWGILGNPHLRPEKNTASEVGADFFSADGRRRLAVTAFFNRFSNLIEFTFFNQPGEPNYVNVEKARSRGIELEGAANAAGPLWLGFNYTLTGTEVTDAGTDPSGNFVQGQALLRRPRHMAVAYALVSSPRLQARFSLRFKGERDDRQFFPDYSSRRVTLPSYVLTDFSLKIPLFHLDDHAAQISAIVRGQNLFGVDYMEIAGFEAPGRTVWAGIRLDY